MPPSAHLHLLGFTNVGEATRWARDDFTHPLIPPRSHIARMRSALHLTESRPATGQITCIEIIYDDPYDSALMSRWNIYPLQPEREGDNNGHQNVRPTVINYTNP